MLNLTMSILHKVPLAYKGVCLVGLVYCYHHSGLFEFNPFTGIARVYPAPGCGVDKCVRAIITEDKINGLKEGTWTELCIPQWPYGILYLDCKTKDYQGIDIVKITDPDVTNPKYWYIGFVKVYMPINYDYPRNFPWVTPSGHIIQRSQLLYDVNLPNSYPMYFHPIINVKDIIDSQVRLLHSELYREFSNDGFIKLYLPGTSGIYQMMGGLIFNFNIDLYKNEHPNLYRIYYILYNSKPVNNIRFKPLLKEVYNA